MNNALSSLARRLETHVVVLKKVGKGIVAQYGAFI